MPVFKPFRRNSKAEITEKDGLWELSSPIEGCPPSVDIVAVHGLNGDAFDTWTKEGRMWLRDFLPKKLPDARIFTFGYDAVVAFSKSSGEVDDFARILLQRVKSVRSPAEAHSRPLYFICHSLGGIVVKQALNLAYGDGDTDMVKCVSGIIFMGTPHSGSNIAFWGSIAANLLHTVSLGTSTNKGLLKVLHRNSLFLENVSRFFKLFCQDLQVLSFYELERFRGLSCRIVDRESATLHLSRETLIPVSADHAAMCRFDDASSQAYDVVEDAIVSFVHGSASSTSTSTPSLNSSARIDVNRQRALNEWLDPSPTIDTFHRIKSQKREGSCQWIFQNKYFRAWRAESRWRVCHMEGPPGYGKSTVVTELIDQLSLHHPVAYFFCRVGLEHQSWSDIIKTWTWQLLEQRPQRELINGVFNFHLATLGTTTPLMQYFRALIWLLGQLHSPYIFLDGLDENPALQDIGAQEFSSQFQDISRYAKMFTSSRPDPGIGYTLPTETGGFIRLVVERNANEGDISSFIEDGVSRLRCDEPTSNLVRNKLSAGANGMFLWTKLMLHHLHHQVTLGGIKAALEEPLDGLDPIYSRILSNMANQPAPRARIAARVLQWVYSATRPLSLSELEIALAIDPKLGYYSDRLTKENWVQNIRAVVQESCAPLLEIHDRNETVRFAHASAPQYLQTLAAPGSPRPYNLDRFPLVPARRLPYLAACCLAYLADPDIDFVKPDSSKFVFAANREEHLAKHKFLHYAALNLWEHFPQLDDGADSASSSGLKIALASFFSTEKSLVKWLQLYQVLGGTAKLGRKGEFHPEARRFASLKKYPPFGQLGFTDGKMFVRWDRWVSEDTLNGHHCSPITIASFFDFTSVVREQLDAGVSVDDDAVFGYTPFLYAVHGDASRAAKLLVLAGADPMKTTQLGYGAARYASRNCLKILPSILNTKGPWMSQQDCEGRTVLHAITASVGWHPDVMIGFLSLSTAEDLARPDSLGRTALHMAASINSSDLAALLWHRLSRGHESMDNEPHGLLSTSIQEAFTPSTSHAIKAWASDWQSFLKRRGALREDTSTGTQLAGHPTISNRGILQNLVQEIKSFILQEILRLIGPAVDMVDTLGRTALHIAADLRHQASDNKASEPVMSDKYKSIEQLLAADLDPFMRNKAGQLPVHVASALCDWSVVMLLSTAMQERTKMAGRVKRSVMERKTTLDLQRFLGEQDNEAPPPIAAETAWMARNKKGPFGRSLQDVAEVTVMLRDRFSTCSSTLGQDEKVRTTLVRRILDIAAYWVGTAAAVDIGGLRSHPDPPRVPLRLERGHVRKIEIFVAAPKHYYGCKKLKRRSTLEYPIRADVKSCAADKFGQRCWPRQPGTESDGTQADSSDEDGDCHPSHPVVPPSLGLLNSLQDDGAADEVGHPFLRWSSPAADDEPGKPLPPPILGDSKLWVHVPFSGDLDVSKQTWPVALTHDSARYRTLGKATRRWLNSLEEGQQINLTVAEGFSLHRDIAKFSRFGVVVYRDTIF